MQDLGSPTAEPGQYGSVFVLAASCFKEKNRPTVCRFKTGPIPSQAQEHRHLPVPVITGRRVSTGTVSLEEVFIKTYT